MQIIIFLRKDGCNMRWPKQLHCAEVKSWDKVILQNTAQLVLEIQKKNNNKKKKVNLQKRFY